MPSSFRDLIAWQRAMTLARSVFALARDLRAARHFGLAAQVERAAISVPANIAEGQGRRRPREFIRFLDISAGSLREVETLIMLAGDIGVAQHETVGVLLRQADEVGKVLHGLRRAIGTAENRQPQLPTDG